jgi:hypothetical protein
MRPTFKGQAPDEQSCGLPISLQQRGYRYDLHQSLCIIKAFNRSLGFNRWRLL